MDVKVPVTQPQIQPPGQPVVMKVSELGGGGGIAPKISLGSHPVTKIIAGVTMMLLVSGVGVGVYLVGQQQQVKSQADEIPENIAKVVPKKDINPNATLSAQSRTSTSPAATKGPSSSSGLDNIVVPPELNDPVGGSDSASLEELYDFNQDGMINSIDLSFMYTNWGASQNENQAKADLNDDGSVNGLDYSLILPYFKN